MKHIDEQAIDEQAQCAVALDGKAHHIIG